MLNLISYKVGIDGFSQVAFINIILYIHFNVVVFYNRHIY